MTKSTDSGHFIVRASNFIGASATEFYLHVPTEEEEAEQAEGEIMLLTESRDRM